MPSLSDVPPLPDPSGCVDIRADIPGPRKWAAAIGTRCSKIRHAAIPLEEGVRHAARQSTTPGFVERRRRCAVPGTATRWHVHRFDAPSSPLRHKDQATLDVFPAPRIRSSPSGIVSVNPHGNLFVPGSRCRSTMAETEEGPTVEAAPPFPVSPSGRAAVPLFSPVRSRR